MRHPLHAHDLEQVDPLITYPRVNGHWRCDNCCRGCGPSFGRPYHCRICSYDLCQTCINSEVHTTLAHEHPLLHMNTSMLYQDSNGEWRCDACHGVSTDLGQTHSYHCEICSFDLCQSCFESKDHPVHGHPIQKSDTRVAYPGTSGSWMCDVCSTAGRPFERFAYHCAECQFDVCDRCFEGCDSPHHSHHLVKADSHVVYRRFNGGWRCDRCGSVHNAPGDRWPWHCQSCEFDLCATCMNTPRLVQRGFDVPAQIFTPISSDLYGLRAENPWQLRDAVSTPSVHSPVDSPAEFRSERGNAVTFPAEERKEEVVRKASETESTDVGKVCIICLEQPKNATLIHGDTGHCCCCWACGQVLMRRRDPCPICRAPIEKVIRQYNS